jgi:chromosomal replication initiation ATPase DnaA
MSSADTPSQLTLELPHLAAAGLDNFYISASNASAVALVESWPHWPAAGAVLCGPEGSGKTHLAEAWRARAAGGVKTSERLGEAAIAAFDAAVALVVEDIDHGIGDERILFHILNLAREKNTSVLLTSAKAPGDLSVALPDLRSRLRALPVAHIEPPDEALLRAVLVKLFADRQLTVEPHVIAHLALHSERSLAMANRVVAAADQLALARQRRVTRAIAAEALDTVMRSKD